MLLHYLDQNAYLLFTKAVFSYQHEEIFTYYEAAKNGMGMAAYILGRTYYTGRGIEKNIPQSWTCDINE